MRAPGRFSCAVVLSAVWLAGVSPTAQAGLSTRAIVDAASAYVAAYQKQLTSIVAEETYVQRIVQQVPPEADMPRVRELTGEMFFVFAHPERQWMALRDVQRVDGADVGHRGNIREELLTRSAGDVAAALRRTNARFNLGRVMRNVN